jgi:hypothetical protein
MRERKGSNLFLEIALVFLSPCPELDAVQAGGRESEALDLQQQQQQSGEVKAERGEGDLREIELVIFVSNEVTDDLH